MIKKVVIGKMMTLDGMMRASMHHQTKPVKQPPRGKDVTSVRFLGPHLHWTCPGVSGASRLFFNDKNILSFP